MRRTWALLGLYRLRSAGFALIRALLESAKAVLPREQRYQTLREKFTGDDLLGRMFALVDPSVQENNTYASVEESRLCIEARNRSLIYIVVALAAPGNCGAWFDDPRNEGYVRQWILRSLRGPAASGGPPLGHSGHHCCPGPSSSSILRKTPRVTGEVTMFNKPWWRRFFMNGRRQVQPSKRTA